MKGNGFRGDVRRDPSLPALLPKQRLCLKLVNDERCVLGRYHKGKCRNR